MPKKPRTNKRPPPKALPPKTAAPAPAPATAPAIPPNRPAPPGQYGSVPNPYLDHNGQPVEFTSFVPPPSIIDPKDPNFPAALSDWSASTLGKLNALPKFTQGQLSAIAEAAVGVGNPAAAAQMGTLTTSANGLPIDLPASLAALFEAKLTLDREKAKLLRMQKELKAHREQMHGVGNGKGKQVAVEEDDDDLLDCSCAAHDHHHHHHHHHDYPASAHSGERSDDYCYETDEEAYMCESGCVCDCHGDHDEDCDCGECQEADAYHEAHHQSHSHGHGHGHHHHGHHHHDHYHDHDHPDEDEEIEHEIDIEVSGPYPMPPIHHHHQQQQPQNNIAEQVRNATVQLKNATAEANRAALLAEAQQGQRTGQYQYPYPPAGLLGGVAGQPGSRQNLSEDPDRLDELVRELFNWIKAVVWTIEQAAVVAGRRNWHNQSQVD